MPIWNKLTLPNANSPQSEQMLFFHDHTMLVLVMIIAFVLYLLMSTCRNKFFNKLLLDNQELETIWTSLPVLILILIAFPSLMILYSMEETPESSILTTKISAHQWYWSYSIPSINFNMDSFPSLPSNNDHFRLLDTNQRLILPTFSTSRLLITSMDVIHSWTIPSLGVKTDATPGRINQINIFPLRPGLYFGQCSEICGINHSFMPITLETIPFDSFMSWLNNSP